MRKYSRKRRIHDEAGWQKRAVKHAIRRLGERYRLHLSEPEYWTHVTEIQMGRAKLLHRQTSSRLWYELEIEGRKVIAVYSLTHQRINTFLDADAMALIGRRREDVA